MQQTKKKVTNTLQSTYLEQLKGISSNPVRPSRNLSTQFWGEQSGESYETMSPPEKIEKKELPKKGAYESRGETILFTAREQQVVREIETIRAELILLVKTVEEVDFEVSKAIREIPVKPGVYHVRFLERIKKILKLIREKLEDSKTWLRLSVGKRKQKSYWCQYKKKGTSFGLSGERVVSTQTG